MTTTCADLLGPSVRRRAWLYDVGLIVGGSLVLTLAARIAQERVSGRWMI